MWSDFSSLGARTSFIFNVKRNIKREKNGKSFAPLQRKRKQMPNSVNVSAFADQLCAGWGKFSLTWVTYHARPVFFYSNIFRWRREIFLRSQPNCGDIGRAERNAFYQQRRRRHFPHPSQYGALGSLHTKKAQHPQSSPATPALIK